ncbi:SMI1/KNR4 family protein [Frigoriglobus tundricola]|uniref:SMI1/KNR4 family protein n=1 Tax=Frigoriglobus tundricola TaxID=2774151 RepID=UPI00148EE801|nr:SMI1/KNR4 family protein [Frigoriglobus tundricola]
MSGMTQEYSEALIAAHDHLVAKGVPFNNGLTDEEVRSIEDRFAFRFPPDLRAFLQYAIPIGKGFPDWRGSDRHLWEMLRWPEEGIIFDIRNNVFWWPDWGDKPSEESAAVEIATTRLRQLPPLIPVFGHSYLPCAPLEPGNPVFSIHQADVIHRGRNLSDFLLWVHHDPADESIESKYPVYEPDYRHIIFWTDLTRKNYDLS